MKKNNNAVLYGIIGAVALLFFYLGIVSIFQGIGFAFLNLRSLWYLVFPLAAGFGIQIGLFFSIIRTARVTATVSGTGAVSGGSMLACCSHFILNILPFAGFAGLATVLMAYQSWFLGVGILSNVIGIGFMVSHKKKMKGGLCCEE